jgi:site-specific DNA-methyltransferase (adenine-specific)
MNKDLMFSSESSEWETPDEFFDILDMEYNFQVDLAASESNKKCNLFFSQEDNALDKVWSLYHGYLWLNPPYGKTIKDWVEKCDEQAQQGAKIIALLPARTDTRWFHNHIYKKYEVKFLKGRLKFLLNGEMQNAAPFPSMLVIFEKKNK